MQELELEIEDLEEVYPAFKSAAASLSSTLASSPTTIEGDIIQNSSQDTYVHQHQQNLSCGDGDCGGTGDHDIAEVPHIEGSAALSSSKRELVNDDKDSIISQVKVQRVMLYCVLLFCVVMCSVALCYVVLRCVVFCSVALRCVVLCLELLALRVPTPLILTTRYSPADLYQSYSVTDRLTD